MKELEKILKALANKRRLAILKYLKHHREASVSSIAEAIKLSLKATSKHLNILHNIDILEKEQRSLEVYYNLLAVSAQEETVKHILSRLYRNSENPAAGRAG